MSDRMLTDGSPVPVDHSHTKIDPTTGMQKGYVVLTPEERAKGFVKPVRRSYRHIGPQSAPSNLRDLTPEEHERYDQYGYVKFEPYGEDQSPITGKFWTQPELDRAGKHCGSTTTMGVALAETYARDPGFYSGTFCCACSAHYPLNEFKWEPDGEPMDPDKQGAWQADLVVMREAQRQHRIAELKRELAELEKST